MKKAIARPIAIVALILTIAILKVMSLRAVSATVIGRTISIRATMVV
jgi:hypothetical protein